MEVFSKVWSRRHQVHLWAVWTEVSVWPRVQGMYQTLKRIYNSFSQAQCVAGPGLGVFLNLSCSRVEFSFGFPCIGGDLHADININTGVGARNGNIEAHVLGFGGKVGTDGIELNTPWFGGYNIGAIFVWLSYMYIIHPESGVTLSTFLQNVIKKI